jgi:hypothetical protein
MSRLFCYVIDCLVLASSCWMWSQQLLDVGITEAKTLIGLIAQVRCCHVLEVT